MATQTFVRAYMKGVVGNYVKKDNTVRDVDMAEDVCDLFNDRDDHRRVPSFYHRIALEVAIEEEKRLMRK
jgi:hypothetical protein